MTPADNESGLVGKILPDIAAFCTGLALAYYLKWETTDLVWSLWLCSLIMGNVMARPYTNVVRMHLLIFFFAFCHFLKVDSFVVYTVVYFVYFFPWKEIAEAIRKKPSVQTG